MKSLVFVAGLVLATLAPLASSWAAGEGSEALSFGRRIVRGLEETKALEGEVSEVVRARQGPRGGSVSMEELMGTASSAQESSQGVRQRIRGVEPTGPEPTRPRQGDAIPRLEPTERPRVPERLTDRINNDQLPPRRTERTRGFTPFVEPAPQAEPPPPPGFTDMAPQDIPDVHEIAAESIAETEAEMGQLMSAPRPTRAPAPPLRETRPQSAAAPQAPLRPARPPSPPVAPRVPQAPILRPAQAPQVPRPPQVSQPSRAQAPAPTAAPASVPQRPRPVPESAPPQAAQRPPRQQAPEPAPEQPQRSRPSADAPSEAPTRRNQRPVPPRPPTPAAPVRVMVETPAGGKFAGLTQLAIRMDRAQRANPGARLVLNNADFRNWDFTRDVELSLVSELQEMGYEGWSTREANRDATRKFRERLAGMDLSGCSFRGATLGTVLPSLEQLAAIEAAPHGPVARSFMRLGIEQMNAIRQAREMVEAGVQPPGLDLSRAVLINADFTDAIAPGVILSGANLAGATFAGANLAGAQLNGVVGAALVDGQLLKATFKGADVSRANFGTLSIPGTEEVIGANLQGVNLSGTTWSRTSVDGANLAQADLYGARVSDVDFGLAECVEGMRVEGGTWRGVNLGGHALDIDGLTSGQRETRRIRRSR